MTKAELITEIAQSTGIEKDDVTSVLEAFFKTVRLKVAEGTPIYVRGFGSFVAKQRKEKKARIIKKNEEIVVPEHYIPAFKPSKSFSDKVRNSKTIHATLSAIKAQNKSYEKQAEMDTEQMDNDD